MITAPDSPSLPSCLRTFSDRELLSRTERLARVERAATVRLLHHLNEIARRRLFLELGFGSLYDYCVRRLRYSGSSACRRIQAARCIREHPDVLAVLETGELDLAAVSLIAPVITEANREELLSQVRGKSYRSVRRVVAAFGAPVLVERIEPVPAEPTNIEAALFEREIARATPYTPVPDVGEEKFCVQFVASGALMAQVEQVMALLSHQNPHVTFAEELAVVVGEYIARHSPEARERRREKRRAAAARVLVPRAAGNGKPVSARTTAATETRTGQFSTTGAGGNAVTRGRDARREETGRREVRRDNNRSRHIPQGIRDAVFVRDHGRCIFVAGDGTRCGSKRAVQVDHIRPFAAGGTHDPSNLRLLCASQNRFAAERTLGAHVMERYRKEE